MKKLLAVLIVGLLGCPDWEDERKKRCSTLGMNSGFCEGIDAGVSDGGSSDAGFTDAGFTDAGSSDAGTSDAGTADAGPEDAGFIVGPTGGTTYAAFDALTATRTLQTTDNAHVVRSPVSLWEMPNTGKVLVVESRGFGFSLWTEGISGVRSSQHQYCTSASNDRSFRLGYVEMTDGGYTNLSVDDLGANPITNDNNMVLWCATGMAHQRQPDGGFAFVVASTGASPIELERCDPPRGCGPAFATGVSARVDEGAIDGDETAWFAIARGTSASKGVSVLKLLPGSQTTTAVDFGPTTTSPIQLAAAQTNVHLAWVDGQTLWLGRVANSSVAHARSWEFSGPVTLIDLANNGTTTVALLSWARKYGVLLHRDDGSDEAFYELAPGFRFKPTVAHLKTVLRIAGQCLQPDGGAGGDGGAGCAEPWNNPVLEFATQPDGGDW